MLRRAIGFLWWRVTDRVSIRDRLVRQTGERKEEKTMSSPKIVSQAEWLEARKALLMKEKELTRLRDELADERRALPWVRVEKQYVFDAPGGKVTLGDLFDGRSQLFVKHFMLGPG